MKNIDINSTEPIKSIADVDNVFDVFEKRGGYITLDEDLRIRKRIKSGNILAIWINYVKNKLVYKRQGIVRHIVKAHDSVKGKISSKIASSPIAKPFAKEVQNDKVASKRSLLIDSYSDIYKEDSTLRPYQQKAKKEIFESWDEIDNVMFQMPTGTGKTRLFTSIIRDVNDYSLKRREPVKILIVAHRTELIDQIHESLERYKVPHSVIAGNKNRDYKKPVVVASIQTITHKKNLNDAEKLNVRFVIIDEAHHALADTYKKLWDLYPGSKKLGVTATPWRMNHQSFTDLFDKLVMSMPIKDFIKQGYLAPYKYFSLRSDSDILNTIDDIELDEFGDYKESSMEEKMDIGKIRAQLLQSYQSLAKDKKGIIYAINIVHARNVCKEYQEAGYRVVCIDNNTTDAERIDYVRKFRKGELDIIVNVDIFSEGFDCPDIEFIQLARPTRSLVKYLQQVGRGLRITENKQECIILDNVGMYSRFGLPDARRHWKYHFLGHDVEEEEPRKGMSKGTGKTRYVDMSEGTEDMELIQDDYKEIEPTGGSSSAINDFFPLFGITLGKTTWEQAKDMGHEVRKWERGPSRTMVVEDVDFWDHEGVGTFTSIYWTQDESDFPPFWKSKGFDWNLSYDKWIEIFEKLGFIITISQQPCQVFHSRRNTLSAEFEALSPDKTLCFIMDFNYGENGCLTSSPKTLYSITVDYKGVLAEETEDIEEPVDDKTNTQTGHTQTVDESEIEHVYVDIPSADPYIETEREDETPKNEEISKACVSIDVKKLDSIFEKKATSYKYFWFMSIISLAKDRKSLTIPYRDILIRMAAMAWPIVFEYEIDLGKSDMIAKYLNDILKQSTLIKNISNKVVEAYLSVYYDSDGIGKILEPLLKNVPYRFLSPWIKYTTDGEVVEKSNSTDCACLYALQDNSIVLNEEWWEYIKMNYTKICNSAERSFITYLKPNNSHSKLAKFMSKGWRIQ